jgi:hypothetical protein
VGLQTDIRGTAAAVQARADAGDPPQSVAASALAGRVAVFRSAADAVMREVELMHPESAAALELLMQGGGETSGLEGREWDWSPRNTYSAVTVCNRTSALPTLHHRGPARSVGASPPRTAGGGV